MSALPDIPAVAELDAQGARFVLWYQTERNGKPTKVPIQDTGRNALSTESKTWCRLAEASAAADRLRAAGRRVDGIGFVLDATRDGIVGVDLDGCRDPATGAIRPWAGDLIRELASYAEVSPSGTGVKVFVRVDPVPALAANKLLVAKAAGGGKDEAVEVYATGRYFALTGEHLDGTPDEIADATEAFERLAARIAREAERARGKAGRPPPGTTDPAARAGAGGPGPSAGTMRLLADEPALARLWRGEKTRGDASASGLDWSLARALGRAGVAGEEIARVLRAYPHGQVGSGKVAGRAASRRLAQLLDAAREAAEGRGEDEREEIRLAEERVNEAARACAEKLAGELFMRGTLPAVLVRVEDAPGAREADDDEAGDKKAEAAPGVLLAGVRHARGALVFAEPTPERVQFRLDDMVRFVRLDARSGELVPKSCPTALARRIIGAAAELGFRPCAGIVTVPLFVGGRVVTERGYHAPTGLVLDYRGDPPRIPDRPTRRQARRALLAMLRPFRGYLAGVPARQRKPLRAALAAAVLTAVLRPSLPTSPAILLDANQPGAGKGKLARALAVIATGRHPSIVTEGHSDEETEKRLAAAVLSGTSALLLDNLQRTLASSTLESGLTEGFATIRLFGRLTDTTVPFTALALVTANNAALRPDMLRRTLPVRIVVDTDKPELRRFDFEPYAEAARHRPAIVAAALTVARAWWLARGTEEGRRIRRTTLGSFETWADLVAGAVEWLAGVNPVSLIEERKAEDSGRAAEKRAFAALHELFGEREWTAKEAVGEAGDLARPPTGLDPDVWAAALSYKGDRPTANQAGLWLRKRKDKVFGEWQLLGRLDRNGIALWTVRGVRGVAGGVSSSRARSVSDNGSDKSEYGKANTPRDPPHPPQPMEPEAEIDDVAAADIAEPVDDEVEF